MPQQASELIPQETRTEPLDFLREHLNVQWLRPESALWDTIASSLVSKIPFESPSLDLGSGDGLFSFITAGGAFSPQWDRYCSIGPDPMGPERWIVRAPRHRIDWALDLKPDLLRQADGLGFYRNLILSDANRPLPFDSESFQSVFSNILYWLNSADSSFREIARVLRPGGWAWLCLPDHRFREFCVSYRWKESNSKMLQWLNRGRDESLRWTISLSEMERLASRAGLKVVSHVTYLSPLTLKIWDVGLRPLFPVLIRMLEKLGEADRQSAKSEWVETVYPILQELLSLDSRGHGLGGYHFVGLEREPCR